MFCFVPVGVRHVLLVFCLILIVVGHAVASPIPPRTEIATPGGIGDGYAVSDSASALKYELGAMVAGIGAIGLGSWNWGDSSFRMNSEGWFGMDTGSGGTDKLGHMYSSYVISEFLRARLIHNVEAVPRKRAARDAALFSMALMTFVEAFDGVSGDHGFSYEDMVVNSLGVGFSYLRGIYPKLEQKVDLRWQYWPSERSSGFHPIADYEGQKFLVALKPSGFNRFKETPLKYIELHMGYFARGFQRDEGFVEEDRRANVYLGVAFNLEELFFKPNQNLLGRPGKIANTILKYFQIPGTSANHNVMERSNR